MSVEQRRPPYFQCIRCLEIKVSQCRFRLNVPELSQRGTLHSKLIPGNPQCTALGPKMHKEMIMKGKLS